MIVAPAAGNDAQAGKDGADRSLTFRHNLLR
jgi:hypothetical protein